MNKGDRIFVNIRVKNNRLRMIQTDKKDFWIVHRKNETCNRYNDQWVASFYPEYHL